MKLSIKKLFKKQENVDPYSRKLGLERIWLLILLAATAVLMSIAAGLHQQFVWSIERAYNEQIQRMVQNGAGRISDLISHYDASLQSLTEDPVIRDLFQHGSPDQRAEAESRLRYFFPSVWRVKILDTGMHEPLRNLNPPISYACIDTIQKTEGGRKPRVEVHKFGSKDQHIDIVKVVKGADGAVLGTILVTLKVEAIDHLLEKAGFEGYVELQQLGGKGNPVVLASQGNKKLRSGHEASQVSVIGTLWQLSYWASQSELDAVMKDQLVYWGSFAVALLFFVVLLFVLYSIVIKALQRDQVTVISLIRDMNEGSLAYGYSARLSNNQGYIEQLYQMAKDYLKSPTVIKKVTESDAGTPDYERLGTEEQDSLEALVIEDEVSPGTAVVPAEIFLAYDIRGVVGANLTPDVMRQIGQAIGSEAHKRKQQKLVVGHDGRLNADKLVEAMIEGLMSSGRQVINIGQVPTPVVNFATHYLGCGSGVMVTGSHNPPEYSGVKILLQDEILQGHALQELRGRILSGQLHSGPGERQDIDITAHYVDRVINDVRLERPMKIVLDCGNGVTGKLAPALFKRLGCEVTELYCEIDGKFPNHHPDPSKPENMIALVRAVQSAKADLGIAFDGDGDRLGVVDSDGKIIWPDRVLMLLAADVLLRQPGGTVLYDVKCTRNLDRVVRENGGEPLMWKSGYSLMRVKLQETGAVLAGEMSGHIFFKERWFGFDDGLYAAARLLEVLSAETESSARIFAKLPDMVGTPELLMPTAEGEQFELMQQLITQVHFKQARISTLDGLRIEFENAWGLMRASNTVPALVFRFEANSAGELSKIQSEFKQQILAVAPHLALPF